MGILKINRAITKQEPELVERVIEWLQKDCKANMKDVTSITDTLNGYQVFKVEGIGIPKDNEPFDIQLNRIGNNKFDIKILTLNKN